MLNRFSCVKKKTAAPATDPCGEFFSQDVLGCRHSPQQNPMELTVSAGFQLEGGCAKHYLLTPLQNYFWIS